MAVVGNNENNEEKKVQQQLAFPSGQRGSTKDAGAITDYSNNAIASRVRIPPLVPGHYLMGRFHDRFESCNGH